MVIDVGNKRGDLETGEKGWLDGLVVKLNLEPNLSCSMGAAAAEPIDLWARAEIGTRWLFAMEDAGCGRHGHPGGEPFPPFAPDKGNNQVISCSHFPACALSSF